MTNASGSGSKFSKRSSRWHGRKLTRRVKVLTFLAFLIGTLALAGGLVGANHGGGNLEAVGPISSSNGYPVWYRDGHGTEVELCLDLTNPFCGFVGNEVPDPTSPISFPDNFPGETFWWTGDSSIGEGDAKAVLIMAIEGTFATGEIPIPGDQVNFGRIRIRLDSLIPGADYTVTHPYGTTVVTAEGDGSVFVTDDIGPLTVPADYSLTLQSPILDGLLEWDSNLQLIPDDNGDGVPDYLGHPAIDNTVTGSPTGNNFFRVQGPAGTFTDAAVFCAGSSNGSCIETDLFNIMGMRPVTSGVEVLRAVYVDPPESGASNYIEVFVTSGPNQAIEVSGSRIGTVSMAGDGDEYYAKIPVPGIAPSTVLVTNTTDGTSWSAAITDLVTISSAQYDVDLNILTIVAVSSNSSNSVVLSASGSGSLLGALTSGVLSVPLTTAPLNVTVSSSAGGSDTEPVRLVGNDFGRLAVVAVATADPADAIPGQIVLLDGSGSTGEVDTFLWEQISGPAVAIASSEQAVTSILAPNVGGDLEFQLTVTGAAGSDTAFITVTISVGEQPVADAGADQVVFVDDIVILDGTGSEFASTYLWEHVSGPAITIISPDQVTATFTMPAIHPPDGPVVVRLTTSGGGTVTSADTVTISPISDVITISSAELRTDKESLRITGTASVSEVPNEVQVYAGDGADGVTGVLLGTAPVDPGDGTFDLRLRNGVDVAMTTVDIVTRRGGLNDEESLNVRR